MSDLTFSRASTAVIVFHGIGQQRQFDTLNKVADCLGASSAVKASSFPSTVNGGKTLVAHGTIDVEGLSVDLFEAYWSPWPKGKVTSIQVVRFLLAAAIRGVHTYIWNKRRFKRHLFGRSRTFKLSWTTLPTLVLLFIFFASLLLVAASYVWMGLGYASLLSGTKLFDQCLLRDLRTWLFISTSSVVVFSLLFFVGSLISLRVPRVRGKPLGYTLYSFIFILMFLQPLTAFQLGRSVKAFWSVHGSQETSQTGCQASLTDSDLRRMQQFFGLKPLYRPTTETSFLSWVIPTLLSLFVLISYAIAPQFGNAYLGDLVAYLIASHANEFYSLREEIRNRCYLLCREVLGRDLSPEATQVQYKEIVVVAHSLGSVIAYDVLNRILAEDSSKSDLPPTANRLRGLITLGSPLDKAAFLFGYEAQHKTDLRTKLINHLQPLISNEQLRVQLPWINFWSALDPVSTSLQYYDWNEHWEGGIINIRDNQATIPIYAHQGYWTNKSLVSVLQMMCAPGAYSVSDIRKHARLLAKTAHRRGK